jgi:hypothetical protein
MFSSPVLDLVILLSFTYFTGSLILSTFNEALSSIFRTRPRQLQQSLETLFFSSSWTSWVQNTLMKSPHIQSLMKAQDKYPSYIPASNFVLVVIGQIGAASFNQAGLQQAILTSALPLQFKSVLADLAAKGGNDIAAFQKSLEDFYNNAMDRAGGVYKRKIRIYLFLIGFLVACLLNLDTIQIVQQELANKAGLDESAARISAQLPKIKINKDSLETVTLQSDNGTLQINRKVDASKNLDQSVKQVKDLTVYLGQTSGYTLGYTAAGGFATQWGKIHDGKDGFVLMIFLKKLLGILITAFALQLSSSFWFDLMNKAVNIRAAGAKPVTNNPDK